MIETPAAREAAGPLKVTASPSSSNRPLSAACTPARIFTSVDLPAPFSPSSACASPGYRVIDPSSRARTAPNLLAACSSTSTGDGLRWSVTSSSIHVIHPRHPSVVKPFTDRDQGVRGVHVVLAKRGRCDRVERFKYVKQCRAMSQACQGQLRPDA